MADEKTDQKATSRRTLHIDNPGHYVSDAQIAEALDAKLSDEGKARDGDYEVVSREETSGTEAKVVVEFVEAIPTASGSKAKTANSPAEK